MFFENLKNNFVVFIELTRLNKPIGIYLLLSPTLTALFIAANGVPSIKLILIFTLGVILTRSAGCVINDFADRNFDGFVERSKNRPLVTKKISPKSAIIIFVVILLFAFLLVLQTNLLTISLSLIAVLLMSIYPFMKRFTNNPQLFLGFAFAWGVPMVFAAQNNQINSSSFWLFAFVIFWVMAYDTIYAMVDKEDDLKIGVKSTAILFTPYERIWIGFFQGLMLFCLIMVGIKFNLSLIYFMGVLVTLGFIIYQQILIKNQEINNCFKAFLNNHLLGWMIFGFTLLNYWVN